MSPFKMPAGTENDVQHLINLGLICVNSNANFCASIEKGGFPVDRVVNPQYRRGQAMMNRRRTGAL